MKDLKDMTLEELWDLFPIILTEPNPEWSEWAKQEINQLNSLLKDEIASIHHIGSTAIKGIWAKPIIDLLVEISDKNNWKSVKDLIEASGYISMKETASRIDFNKGYTPNGFAEKVFHLHLRNSDDNKEIYFRDYLNEHPDVAKEYEQLKLSLWKEYEHNRDGYTEAKTDFINRYTSLAEALISIMKKK